MRLRELLLFGAVFAAALRPANAQEAVKPLPQVISHGEVVYPPLARMARIQGSVHLQITTDGHAVIGVATRDGNPLLSRVAEDNVRTWKFIDHAPGTYDATFNFRVLSDKATFLQEPGIVDIAMLAPQTRQDYTLPVFWTAQLQSARDSIEAPLSLWTYGRELQGYAQGPPSREREIRNTHHDGDLLGFDATLDNSHGETLKFSLLGKKTGDKIQGVLLDYGGTRGTWTATRSTPAAADTVPATPDGAPRLITLPEITERREPEYPRLPFEAQIQGGVHLLVTTNGITLVFNDMRQDYDSKPLLTITRESGDPLLADAAEGNIRTWGFASPGPTPFEVTFNYRFLEPRTAFLDQPGVVDVAVPQPPTNVDSYPLDTPPQIWRVEFTSPKGKMRATFSFYRDSCCDGEVIDIRGGKTDIHQAHSDGDMVGFDATFRTADGRPIKVSLIGKMTKNRMAGVFLDYSGMAGTWTAELTSRSTSR